MKLHELQATPGAQKAVRRIGRGHGSGQGKTAGKGHKGQKARSGGGVRPGFEGGQMPLQIRIPKRGFNNIYRKEFVPVNLGSLNAFDAGSVVDRTALIQAGIIKKSAGNVKILSNGALTKKLTVKANAFSKSAKSKIEEVGGKTEVV